MCKFFRKEKFNHHFPELNKKNKISRSLLGFLNGRQFATLVVALTLVIGVFYLIQINFSATKGYQIRQLEKELNELKMENKRINLQYLEKQSMANLVERASQLNLVVIDNLEIITPLGSVMALR